MRNTSVVSEKIREHVALLKSVHLQNERTIWIRRPRTRSPAGNLTVFLDGELYRDHIGATAVVDGLLDAIADSWLVFVSMQSVEARWRECPCYPPFARFIAEELMPWLESSYEGIKTVRKRILTGLSYTGLAAAFVARQHPGVFHKVISQSGSFWWNDCWLAEQFRSQPRLPTEFYLDVGTKELDENVRHREDVLQVVSQIEGVRRLRDALREAGHSVSYVEFEGGHDFVSWRQSLPGALQWALPVTDSQNNRIKPP